MEEQKETRKEISTMNKAGATYMLWAKAQEYNAQVNMATTVVEVEAIVWTA